MFKPLRLVVTIVALAASLLAAVPASGAAPTGTASISGRLLVTTNEDTIDYVRIKRPVDQGTVTLRRCASTCSAVATAPTNKNGEYAFSKLAAGTYVLEFNGRNAQDGAFVTEYWENAYSVADASRIQLGVGERRTAVNALLDRYDTYTFSVASRELDFSAMDPVLMLHRLTPEGFVEVDRREMTSAPVVMRLRPGTYVAEVIDRAGIAPRQTVPYNADLAGTRGFSATGGYSSGATIYLDPVEAVMRKAPPILSPEGPVALGVPLTVQGGTWAPEPDAITYQWFSDGEPIPGATDNTFVPDENHAGLHLAVEVSAIKAGHRRDTWTRDLGRISGLPVRDLVLEARSSTRARFSWLPASARYQTVRVTDSRTGKTWAYPVDTPSERTERVVHTVVGLAPDSKFTVSMQGFSSIDPVGDPVSVSFTTGPMARPSSFRTTAVSSSAVRLAWARPLGGTKYRVILARNGKRRIVTLGNVNTARIDRLASKSTYLMRVEAITTDGRSVTSSSTITVKTK